METIKKPLDSYNYEIGDKMNKNKNKKSQVTILIILAIVIVAGIVVYFAFRQGLAFGGPLKDIKPVYNHYLTCIEQETVNGISILSQQAGYIESEFSPGSAYMPFSSHLNFLGIGITYWYYISGNGVVKEQIPSKEKMEQELNNFLKSRLQECDFSEFIARGFEVSLDAQEKTEVKTKIRKNAIEVSVTQNIAIKTENVSWTGKKHSKKVDSNLGKFYELAKKIYDDFKETQFLENYTVDVLRLYAPVDGVEISCSPKIWNVEGVRENLTTALEANIPQIKVKGSYYQLKNPDNKYFVHDIDEDVDANINFLFSKNWPNKMEVWPAEQGLLLAQPVGIQEGLGMLGFCYVPYHFVYDLAFPVLIQLYYNDEIFQFPVVVFINKNKPRQPIDTIGLPNVVPELCEHKNTEITVSTYNVNLEPVDASIQFKCFDTTCDIGKTSLTGSKATLTSKFPQCANGYIIANAKDYETKKHLFSTITPSTTEIFLDKTYDLNLEIKPLNEKDYAIITFTKNKTVKTIAYPEQKQISLASGQYEIKAYIYSNAKIKLQGASEQKCIQVSKSGVLGVFRFTEEECFTFEIPEQTIDTAVSGGGTQNYYISESELQNSKKLTIEATDFQTPTKVEDLRINYNSIEISRLKIMFE